MLFRPSLKERWRWWKWFFTSPLFSRAATDLDHRCFRIMQERHWANEPWPRRRWPPFGERYRWRRGRWISARMADCRETEDLPAMLDRECPAKQSVKFQL